MSLVMKRHRVHWSGVPILPFSRTRLLFFGRMTPYFHYVGLHCAIALMANGFNVLLAMDPLASAKFSRRKVVLMVSYFVVKHVRSGGQWSCWDRMRKLNLLEVSMPHVVLWLHSEAFFSFFITNSNDSLHQAEVIICHSCYNVFSQICLFTHWLIYNMRWNLRHFI